MQANCVTLRIRPPQGRYLLLQQLIRSAPSFTRAAEQTARGTALHAVPSNGESHFRADCGRQRTAHQDLNCARQYLSDILRHIVADAVNKRISTWCMTFSRISGGRQRKSGEIDRLSGLLPLSCTPAYVLLDHQRDVLDWRQPNQEENRLRKTKVWRTRRANTSEVRGEQAMSVSISIQSEGSRRKHASGSGTNFTARSTFRGFTLVDCSPRSQCWPSSRLWRRGR